MTDYADKSYLRRPSLVERAARFIVDMLIVAAVIVVLAVIINRNEAFGAKQICSPGSICVLLDNSMLPASMDECQIARPDLGRPYFTASKRDRTNEPWFTRTCFFSAP